MPDGAECDERERAAQAVSALRLAVADPSAAGERQVTFIDWRTPGGRRRGTCLTTWENLPGLTLDMGRGAYAHVLLPGWEYDPREMRTEMIEDLERLAKAGERPKVATRRA
jgi:hypothetical protein